MFTKLNNQNSIRSRAIKTVSWCLLGIVTLAAAAVVSSTSANAVFCITLYQPVCAVKNGVNKTYSNTCVAEEQNGAKVIYQGKCKNQKVEDCRNYALKAVDQNREAQKNRCGFIGPEWTNRHQNHYDWCMRGNNINLVWGANTNRQNALQQCKSNVQTSSKKFNNPSWNGAIVDNCSTWATNCGIGGAENFCRLKGFNRALSYVLNRPGRTYVLGSQRFCDGPNCVGYQSVTCTQ